jgi:hypothetical protein
LAIGLETKDHSLSFIALHKNAISGFEASQFLTALFTNPAFVTASAGKRMNAVKSLRFRSSAHG